MSEPQQQLRIDRITLENFRCFGGCPPIDLHSTLNIFVAENGQGKTAILDALGIALDVFVSAIARGRLSRGFDRSDVRAVRTDIFEMTPALPTRFSAEGYVDGVSIVWSRTVKRATDRARNTTTGTKALRLIANRMRDAAQPSEGRTAQPVTLPLAVFYGTGRLWSEHRLTKEKQSVAAASPHRFAAYADCLSSSSSFKAFTTWYEAAVKAARDPAFKVMGADERPERHLNAVHQAVQVVLQPTGWKMLGWHFPVATEDGRVVGRGYIEVEHELRGRFPLSWLSDGIRNMVALAGDIAHRCVRLNPHLGEDAARLTPGVLLIDEVDMHLHPRWQQRVVELLQTAFPAMQMILTTHSPHVLSTVDADSIRIIRFARGECSIERPAFQTRGVESAAVLAVVMGVHPVPDVEPANLLSSYRALVQNGQDQSPHALEIWERLVQHYGAEHQVLQEAAVLRRLQEFRRDRNL